MTRVLILREAGAARRTADALRARGWEPVLAPLETVRHLDPPPPPGRIDGFIVTSAHAVSWLSRHFPADARPVLAVGATTAAALRAAHFPDVTAAGGSAADLAGAILRGSAGPGMLLYAAGVDRRPDLEAALERAGRRFVTVECYAVVFRAPDTSERAHVTGPEAADCVLLLSVGQAGAFAAMAPADAPGPRAFCLSERIAGALPPRLRRNCVVSPVPTLDGLLAMLDDERCSIGARRYMQ